MVLTMLKIKVIGVSYSWGKTLSVSTIYISVTKILGLQNLFRHTIIIQEYVGQVSDSRVITGSQGYHLSNYISICDLCNKQNILH